MRRSDPSAAMCKHVPDTQPRRRDAPQSRRRREAEERSERRVNRSAAQRGRKILLRLYLFSTFFPGRATAREPALPPPRRSPLFSAALLFLSICLPFRRTILRVANASVFPYPPPLRLCLEMWHSTGLPRCLRWCGIRAGLPLRARPGGGCIGEMMRRLAGSSQKPPPSRLLTLLYLLRRPSSSSSSFIPLALVSHRSPSLPLARARGETLALSHPRFGFVARAALPQQRTPFLSRPRSSTVAKGWNTTPTATPPPHHRRTTAAHHRTTIPTATAVDDE